MSQTAKIQVCIFNQENGALLRAGCVSLSTTSMQKSLRKLGVKITDIAFDVHGICIQTQTFDNAVCVKHFIDNKQN